MPPWCWKHDRKHSTLDLHPANSPHEYAWVAYINLTGEERHPDDRLDAYLKYQACIRNKSNTIREVIGPFKTLEEAKAAVLAIVVLEGN